MRVLGIFVKQPVAGSVKTRLARDIGAAAAAEFYSAAMFDLRTACAELGDVRIMGYSPNTDSARHYFRSLAATTFDLWPQPSEDLGRRMEDFFEHALAHDSAGGVQAVLIGSDSPNLPVELIESAFESLKRNDVVLGPATDGGYYLIGLRRQTAGWLANVRWSSPHTLQDSVQAALKHGLSLAVLPPWYDVDTVTDLQTLAGHLTLLRAADPARRESQTEHWITRWQRQEAATRGS